MLKSIYYSIILFVLFNFSTFSQNFISINRSGRILFTSGISYNFNISQDLMQKKDLAFIEVPLKINLDFRLIKWISLQFGFDLFYNYHLYQIDDVNINNHNLFIRLPLTLKVYPLSNMDERYNNVYLGFGVFAQFWPLNQYYINTVQKYSGNAYQPDETLNYLYPGDVYTKSNIGFTFSLGNHFFFSQRAFFGIEMFTNYLFIPFLNGYWATPDYWINEHVMLNFMINVGIGITIGLEFFSY